MKLSDTIIASTKYLSGKLPSEFQQKINIIGKYLPDNDLSFINNQRLIESRKTIAFYGTDHTHDFKDCFNALEDLLSVRSDVLFINIGGTRLPKKISLLPNVKTFNIKLDYQIYSALIRSIPIYIGLAPLADLEFNNCKADTKFVEYTSCNAVTVTNNYRVYPHALVISTNNDPQNNSKNWFIALEKLLSDEDFWAKHMTIAKNAVFSRKNES